MAFIPQPQIPSDLAALVARLQSQLNDPIAEGIGTASRSFADAIRARHESAEAGRRQQEALRTLAVRQEQQDLFGLAEKGMLADAVGNPITIGGLYAAMGRTVPAEGIAALRIQSRPKPAEVGHDKIPVTDEMVRKYPGLVRGSYIPSTFLAELETKGASRAKDAPMTDAQKTVDKAFGKDYNEFVVSGGYADVAKQLDQLRGVVGELQGKGTEENPKGVRASGARGLVPKVIRDVVMPKGAAIQDRVEDVVQRNLRLVLGAQFTEKEGERLIARAYNPRQPESENIKRLGRLITQIDEAAKAKAEAGAYYEQNGTLKGFKGKIYRSANDFLGGDGSGETISIQASDGTKHTIFKKNLAAAKKRDPNLKVLED